MTPPPIVLPDPEHIRAAIDAANRRARLLRKLLRIVTLLQDALAALAAESRLTAPADKPKPDTA